MLKPTLYKLMDSVWANYPPLAELRAAGLPEDRQEQLRLLWPRVPQRLRPIALHIAFALARFEILLNEGWQGPRRRR